MAQYQTPGVYVEEVSSGSKPIEAGAMNVVGFLGIAQKGPVDAPVLVTNWTQYNKIFGGMHTGGWLGHAVYLFFQNGGTKCYINNLAECGETAARSKAVKGAEESSEKKAPNTAQIANPDNITKLIIGKDGGPGKRTGLMAFNEISDISLVCAPGVSDPAAQDAILSHCEQLRYRVAILDAPETLEKGIDTIPMPRDSTMGGYYFPWVQMYDTELDKEIFAPP